MLPLDPKRGWSFVFVKVMSSRGHRSALMIPPLGRERRSSTTSLWAAPSPGHNSGERAPFISSEKYFISSHISPRPPGLTWWIYFGAGRGENMAAVYLHTGGNLGSRAIGGFFFFIVNWIINRGIYFDVINLRFNLRVLNILFAVWKIQVLYLDII